MGRATIKVRVPKSSAPCPFFYCREMLKPSFFCIRAWQLRDFLVRSLWNSAVSARFILLCQNLRLHPIRFWCSLSNMKREPFICWQVLRFLCFVPALGIWRGITNLFGPFEVGVVVFLMHYYYLFINLYIKSREIIQRAIS